MCAPISLLESRRLRGENSTNRFGVERPGDGFREERGDAQLADLFRKFAVDRNGVRHQEVFQAIGVLNLLRRGVVRQVQYAVRRPGVYLGRPRSADHFDRIPNRPPCIYDVINSSVGDSGGGAKKKMYSVVLDNESKRHKIVKYIKDKRKHHHNSHDAFTSSDIPHHERGRVRSIIVLQTLRIAHECDAYVVVPRQLLQRAPKRVRPEDLILVRRHHGDLRRLPLLPAGGGVVPVVPLLLLPPPPVVVVVVEQLLVEVRGRDRSWHQVVHGHRRPEEPLHEGIVQVAADDAVDTHLLEQSRDVRGGDRLPLQPRAAILPRVSVVGYHGADALRGPPPYGAHRQQQLQYGIRGGGAAHNVHLLPPYPLVDLDASFAVGVGSDAYHVQARPEEVGHLLPQVLRGREREEAETRTHVLPDLCALVEVHLLRIHLISTETPASDGVDAPQYDVPGGCRPRGGVVRDDDRRGRVGRGQETVAAAAAVVVARRRPRPSRRQTGPVGAGVGPSGSAAVAALARAEAGVEHLRGIRRYRPEDWDLAAERVVVVAAAAIVLAGGGGGGGRRGEPRRGDDGRRGGEAEGPAAVVSPRRGRRRRRGRRGRHAGDARRREEMMATMMADHQTGGHANHG